MENANNMELAINGLSEQFNWTPELTNADKLKTVDKFVVCGMGGSHLAAGLLKIARPKFDLIIHRDYGLPPVPDDALRHSLIIISSFSGNTEEAIDAFRVAGEAGLSRLVIADRGELLELARSEVVPFIDLPGTGIQPRMALGYNLMALAQVVNDTELGNELRGLAQTLKPGDWRERGEELAQKLRGKIPVVYSSTRNLPLVYNWKIKLNETGKTPAFYNIFPELNHNELEGWGGGKNPDLFHFVVLRDQTDNPAIVRRAEITASLLQNRGYGVELLDLEGATMWERIFNSLLLADWTSFSLAQTADLDPTSVPLIEEFKRKLAS